VGPTQPDPAPLRPALAAGLEAAAASVTTALRNRLGS